MLNVHQVRKNTDEVEGKGTMLLRCAFTSKDDAISYILAQKSPYGLPMQNPDGSFRGWDIEPLVVYESLQESDYDETRHQRNQLAAQARAKLTPEELEALGLGPA